MPATTTNSTDTAEIGLLQDREPRSHGWQADRTVTWKSSVLPLAVTAVLLALLYGAIAGKLVYDWYDLPDASHGFLIPIFVAFLLWTERQRLQATPIQQSWAGLAIVVPALLLLLVGVFGADLFLSRFSFVLLAAGLIQTAMGSVFSRRLLFVYFVMLLAIPLPAVVLNQLTFPLQLLASLLASSMLPLAGVPVLRDGNVIQLASMQLEVAEACSGIRSLVSLFTMAVIFGYLFERRPLQRVVLALCSIPIAVFANSVRIFGTGLCVQYWDPDKAMGFFHEFSGWLMFLVSLACMYGVHMLLRVRSRQRVTP